MEKEQENLPDPAVDIIIKTDVLKTTTETWNCKQLKVQNNITASQRNMIVAILQLIKNGMNIIAMLNFMILDKEIQHVHFVMHYSGKMNKWKKTRRKTKYHPINWILELNVVAMDRLLLNQLTTANSLKI